MSKEYAVGEFFKVGKDTYKVVVDTHAMCEICDIEYLSPACETSFCAAKYRSDNMEVCFILHDQEPDEEEEENADY